MNSGQLSQDEINALLNGSGDLSQPPADSGGGGQMSQADIDALMNPAPAASSAQMSQDEINALLNNDPPAAPTPDGTGPMSQDEINAFLAGSGDTPAEDSTQMTQAEMDALMAPMPESAPRDMNNLMAPLDENPNLDLPKLTEIEVDAMGEIGNISMGTAATTLAVLLGRRVSITTPKVSVTTFAELKKYYPLPCLVVEVGYTEGILGTNLLTVPEKDALIIASLMMGGDGLNPPDILDEISMSAVAESMNQMMGSTATSLSTIFKKRVDIAPPKVNLIDLATDESIANVMPEDAPIVRVSFRMEVEGLIDSYITQIIPYEVAQTMVENLTNVSRSETPKPPEAAAPPAAPPSPAAAPPAPQAAMPQQMPAPQPMPQQVAMPQMQMPPPNYAPPQQQYQQSFVQPAQFQQLAPGSISVPGVANIDLIMDVPLQVTVELGRTKKLIREILEFNPGSVIELDKLAGEPVDILVNGKLIAKGEVVVIDENFGVRITYITNQADRLSTLQ